MRSAPLRFHPDLVLFMCNTLMTAVDWRMSDLEQVKGVIEYIIDSGGQHVHVICQTHVFDGFRALVTTRLDTKRLQTMLGQALHKHGVKL